jgi:DNA repair protein RadC
LIVEAALRHKANTLIVAHNHPGGSLRPSKGDLEVTKMIKEATEAIAIRVVDHIIVAGDQFFSFADNGLL